MAIDVASVDKRAKLYRAVSGLLPGGSLIIEYLIDRIPDQRTERLYAFVKELSDRLNKLEEASFTNDPEYLMLAEQSILDSTKPISEKRTQWLASVATPSEFASELEIQFRRKSVGILDNLLDTDIEYLLVSQDPIAKRDFEQARSSFQFVAEAGTDQHKNILSKQQIFEKQLQNEQWRINQQSLKEQGLLVIMDPAAQEPQYQVSRMGEFFIHVISGVVSGTTASKG